MITVSYLFHVVLFWLVGYILLLYSCITLIFMLIIHLIQKLFTFGFIQKKLVEIHRLSL